MLRLKKNITISLGNTIIILLVILGLFIGYQIIRLLLGGSWKAEDIIVSLLVFNLGAVFTIGLMLATLMSDHKHLSNGFSLLVKDFREHLKSHKRE